MYKILCFLFFAFLICSCEKEEGNGLFKKFSGSFLYTKLTQSGFEIFVLNQMEDQQITNSPQGITTPEWFPDGEKILYLSSDIKGGSLHVINPDGTGDISVYKIGETGTGSFYFPRSYLSPDGRKVLVSRPDSLFLLTVTKEFEVQKVKSLRCKTSLSYVGWAPDSKRFSCRCEGDNSISHLWLYDMESDSFQNLTPQFSYHVARQSWSYQSDKIAFSAQQDIFIANCDGSGVYNLTNSHQFGESTMAFSPVDNQLAYQRSDSLFDLVIYDFNTDETEVLVNDNDFISGPILWIEEGKYISYASGKKLFQEDGYYLFDLSAKKTLTIIDEEISHVDWID